MPPKSRAERVAFGLWLSDALLVTGLSVGQLAKTTGVARVDVEAMVKAKSYDTSKEDRRRVCQFVLDALSANDNGRLPAQGEDPAARLQLVLDGDRESVALFSPKDDLKAAVLQLIKHASDEILIQAWHLSCKQIIDALIQNPSVRKIEIAVSAPHTDHVPSALRSLVSAPGVKLLYEPGRKNHNKTVLVDRSFVLTGSLNFKGMSGQHDENVFITRQSEVVESYLQNFEEKRKRCRSF